MPDIAEDTLLGASERWLGEFETALADGAAAPLEALFHADSHWRDILAFTWRIQTVSGGAAVAKALNEHARTAAPRGFQVDRSRTAPRQVTRGGTETLEAFLRFDTAAGPGEGIVRLTPDPADGGRLKAWTLMTALASIRGHEEHIGAARPTGESYSRDFRGPNWLDLRKESAAYADRDPAVLVVGGGQSGLTAAARLGQLGVDTLIVDRWPRIGDNWRQRYHALTLHNQVQVNHLPYMPFPPNWPTYIPKDKVAGWFEAYVEAMELNYWTGTEFLGGEYDEAAGRWTVRLRREDGSEREMRPRHVVMATGANGVPVIPEIPTLDVFAGTVIHASAYTDGADWAGRKVIIIGTGNSGHDIAQDLHSAGAHVTMVQRSPTLITQVEPSAQLPYALYSEGLPLEECDLITVATPLAVAKHAHQLMTAKSRELDKDLLDALERIGFKLDFGEDGTGWQFKFLTRGGGYYFNVGASDLLASGEIGLIQYGDIEAFVPEGARMKSGETVPADLIVLATGYRNQDYLVRQFFGDPVAERVGPVWGFGDEQELRAMYARTDQPGLWFIAGSFAQCRIYSKYLAMQIKACEEGIIAPG